MARATRPAEAACRSLQRHAPGCHGLGPAGSCASRSSCRGGGVDPNPASGTQSRGIRLSGACEVTCTNCGDPVARGLCEVCGDALVKLRIEAEEEQEDEKARLRSMMTANVHRFLVSGGEIQQIPAGVTGMAPDGMTRAFVEQAERVKKRARATKYGRQYRVPAVVLVQKLVEKTKAGLRRPVLGTDVLATVPADARRVTGDVPPGAEG